MDSRPALVAGLRRRMLATGLDLAMLAALHLAVAFWAYFSGLMDLDPASATAPVVNFLAGAGRWSLALVWVAVIPVFWSRLSATPGKFLAGCQVVVAATGRPPGIVRALVRALCLPISVLPLGLGFFWMAWDRRNQALHDKLAGTLVIVEDEGRLGQRELLGLMT
jgi:uncharacterized RDD family membrane protein YckC